MGLEEIPASQDIDIVDDQDKDWIDDRTKAEVEFDVSNSNRTNKN